MLSQQNHLLAQQTEREPQRRFWRSLGNLILGILEEWLEGMKEKITNKKKECVLFMYSPVGLKNNIDRILQAYYLIFPG
jgi:hypothetical protein